MRKILLSLTVLAGATLAAGAAEAAPRGASAFAPAATVHTVQYRHEWRRHEIERHRRHEWRRYHHRGVW